MKEDFYAILGISKGASASEIKKAYRKKAIEYHPDKNPGDTKAEENFKKAAEAAIPIKRRATSNWVIRPLKVVVLVVVA